MTEHTDFPVPSDPWEADLGISPTLVGKGPLPRQFDHVANAAAVIPAAASASLLTDVITRPQQGEIVAIGLIVTNALCTTPGNPIVITVQNFDGEVYFSSTIQLIAGALAALLLDFSRLRVQFRNGLQLKIANGAASAGNQGQVSLNVIWHA